MSPQDVELEDRFEQPLIETLGQEAYARQRAIGAVMTLDETIELARALVDRVTATTVSSDIP